MKQLIFVCLVAFALIGKCAPLFSKWYANTASPKLTIFKVLVECVFLLNKVQNLVI